ncbi:MAG: GAF domain-containing protein, partial [Anaerolineales bacterium]|nr:GAF domain-containing protein [Anaerolineales bacterium]
DQRIIYVNPSAEAMFEYPAAKLLRHPLAQLLPTRFHARHAQHVADFAASAASARLMQNRTAIVARRRDGSEFPVEASILKVRQQDALLMAVILRDVTAQQRAQASLDQYARRLQALHQMDQAILAAHTPRDVARAALAHLRQLIPYHLASIVAFEESSAELTVLAVATHSPTAETAVVFHDPREDARWREVVARAVIAPRQEDDGLAEILPGAGAHSYMIMPLLVQEKVRGVLSLGADSEDAFGRENMRIIQEVARPVAMAIQQALLLDTERRQRALAETLQQVAGVLNSTLDREQVLRTILEQLARVVDYDSASVMLLDEDELQVVARRDVGVERPFSRLPFGALPHVREVLEEARPVVIADTAVDPRWHATPVTEYIRCWLGVPLVVKRVVIGILNLNKVTPNSYSEQDARIVVAFADQAAVAVENAQLYTRAVQEIFERKQAEAALQAERARLAQRVEERTVELTAANAQLARALRTRDEFLANMTHELRTPLNAILGLTDVLQLGLHGELTAKQRDMLHTISASGARLLELVDDILDVAQIEAGRLQLSLYPMSIAGVCQSSMQLIAPLAAARQQPPPEVDVAPETDVIWADELRVQQILVNLLNNAVKFTPPGGRTGLTVRQDAARDATLFTVWDTGIGIRPADLRRLLGGADGPQPFVQLDSGLNRQYEGTGLGLSLIYRLTELHGGSLTVQSAVGQGSRFTVALPNRWPEPGEEEAAPPGAASGPLVLLAEDNERLLRLLAARLLGAGYRLLLAHNGHEAVHRARETPPDVILLDLQMPELGGLAALR